MGYESSYDVYRTGKHCNIGRICTPMVYIPANTAELPCPLQVIQRLPHSHELRFLVFVTPCQKPCLQFFIRFVPNCAPQIFSCSFRGIPSAARSLFLSRKSFVYRLVRTQYVYVSRRCTMLTMSDSRHTSLHIPHPVSLAVLFKVFLVHFKEITGCDGVVICEFDIIPHSLL